MFNNYFFKSGIVNNSDVRYFFNFYKKKCIILSINCIDINSINSVLKIANDAKIPIIIQFFYSDCNFIYDKFINNMCCRSIICSISNSLHLHNISRYYDIPIFINNVFDGKKKDFFLWINKLLILDEENYYKFGKSLFNFYSFDYFNGLFNKKNFFLLVKILEKMSKMFIGIQINIDNYFYKGNLCFDKNYYFNIFINNINNICKFFYYINNMYFFINFKYFDYYFYYKNNVKIFYKFDLLNDIKKYVINNYNFNICENLLNFSINCNIYSFDFNYLNFYFDLNIIKFDINIDIKNLYLNCIFKYLYNKKNININTNICNIEKNISFFSLNNSNLHDDINKYYQKSIFFSLSKFLYLFLF